MRNAEFIVKTLDLDPSFPPVPRGFLTFQEKDGTFSVCRASAETGRGSKDILVEKFPTRERALTGAIRRVRSAAIKGSCSIKSPPEENKAASELAGFAESHLTDTGLIDRRGSFFYSPSRSAKPGLFYLLGANPPASHHRGATIRDAAESFRRRDENLFWDENGGADLLQKRARFLLRELIKAQIARADDSDAVEEMAREVCAGDFVFAAADRDGDAPDNYEELAEKCWPIHYRVINDIVRPSFILIYGAQAYDYIRRWLRPMGREELLGVGGARCRAYRTCLEYGGVCVVGIPHLAAYPIDEPECAEVVEWIKKRLRWYWRAVGVFNRTIDLLPIPEWLSADFLVVRHKRYYQAHIIKSDGKPGIVAGRGKTAEEAVDSAAALVRKVNYQAREFEFFGTG